MAAIDLCVSSAASMNIAEAPTVDSLLMQLYTTNNKYLEDSEGKLYTPLQALKIIIDEEGSDNGAQN